MSASGTRRTSRHVQPMSAFGGKADIIKRRKCTVIERELFLILSAKPVPDIGFLLCDHRPYGENDLLESLIPAVREKLATLGVEEQLLTVEQFDKFVSDDMAGTLKLAKSAHLEPED